MSEKRLSDLFPRPLTGPQAVFAHLRLHLGQAPTSRYGTGEKYASEFYIICNGAKAKCCSSTTIFIIIGLVIFFMRN
jgi:hypothetical protein